jgi:hypothetical protein
MGRTPPFHPWNYLEYILFGDIGESPGEDVMTLVRRPKAAQQAVTEAVELVIAPAAIERALHLYEQLEPHDTSVILQAQKILTQHIFGMVDQGELDEQKLIAGGLAHLKTIERDHEIKSAHAASKKPGKTRRPPLGTRSKDHP